MKMFPQYGTKQQFVKEANSSSALDEQRQQFVRQVLETSLFNAQEVTPMLITT